LPENSFETDLQQEAQKSLNRLFPRLEDRFSDQISEQPQQWALFIHRMEAHFPRLFKILLRLYGDRYDFFFHLEALTQLMAESWLERDESLKTLDALREKNPDWFQDHRMLGGVGYVREFAGNLAGIRDRIPYFKSLGITYLHLMPLFRCPEGENDGGYAISSYREVDPDLGTMSELRSLAGELRQEGISLVLDFVFNHTSDEHEWAIRAKAGDKTCQDFYRMYPNRQMPDAYEAHLREIFPNEHPGAFTYFADIQQWVWTTFHSNQWDLNYANPEVFNRMAGEMLFLANQGIEILRLDAVAFIWKTLGTDCENLPEAHLVIQAYNAICRIAAPALLFKSEAIVHPDEVAHYISPEECQLSYNPLLMALLWNTLATREVNLLQASMMKRYAIPKGCAWVNYIRCHDDIGWTFSDEDAWALGINPFDHRQFLNAFYTGRFEGSFARGLPFQENPKTGDARISGTLASLAGLEKAITKETETEVDLAIRRILLLHSVILSIGGIPLIYLGDEVGTLNDYSFREDDLKADDSRWVHRPEADQKLYEQREDPKTVSGRIFQGLQKIIQLRKTLPILNDGDAEFIPTGNPHVFGYLRRGNGRQALILSNFSEGEQTIPTRILALSGISPDVEDAISREAISIEADLILKPYQFVWLVEQ
jgi:amylosucrase